MLKDDVLYALERQKGSIVTGGHLANALGVSRTAVWKTINTLKQEGNEIVSISNSGYRLMDTNDTLNERVIRDHLAATFIGQNITILSNVNSTNQYLKEADTAHMSSGHAVIADGQTNGRGRRNRTFLAAKGAGIYVSILLKLDGQKNDLRLLTICAAVAVSKAIEKVCGIRADIKWVNDIFCHGKKICGILTEATISAELQELNTVIVGIGINTAAVPEEISGIATSIQEAAGMRGVRNRLTAEVFNQFETVYLDYIERDERRSILDYYQSRLFIIGHTVIVMETKHVYPATVTGIDETGALIVRDSDGNARHISTGEIKLTRGND